MRLYMDDIRKAPDGWQHTYTVKDTIHLLETRMVTHLSLDNDLGEGQPEGYKVLDWLEEIVYNDVTFPIPEITIHSSNAARVDYMFRALKNIERIREQQA